MITDRQGDLVTSFPSEGWNVSWSPDSARVAVWERWGEQPRSIGVYGLDGERQKLLTGMPPWGEGDPVWSPDGRKLRLGLDWEIPLDGSAPRQLPWAKIHGDVGAAESPDGSQVSYATRRSVLLAAADGSYLQSRAFAELVIDCGEDRVDPGGAGRMVREMERRQAVVSAVR